MKRIIILVAFFLLPLSTSASFDRNLKYGMSGSDVSELQELLNDQSCFNRISTGYFGLQTFNAVKCFQSKNKIPDTGYVGILTRTALNSIITKILTSSTEAEMVETGKIAPKVSSVCPAGFVCTPQNSSPVIPVQHIDALIAIHKPNNPNLTPTPDVTVVPMVSPTPAPVYYPLTIGNYVVNNACVSKGESGTFESIHGTLVTIGLNGTTTSPVTLRSTKSISITVSSPQHLRRIDFNQKGLYEFSFDIEGRGTRTVNNLGTGGELGKVPIIVTAGWSGQEVPTTLDLTINSIKFADGTEVGGLPLKIPNLTISKCTWSN